MHGNYLHEIARVKHDGPAVIYQHGLKFDLIDDNSPAPKYQTRVTEAEFVARVLSRTGETPRTSHVPAIIVDSVRWHDAPSLGQWVGELTAIAARDALASGAATVEAPADVAPSPWSKAA